MQHRSMTVMTMMQIDLTEPTDPEAAALEMIVTAAEEATGSTAFREVLQDFCGLLHAQEGASRSELDRCPPGRRRDLP
jgi:hypothetical protein